MLNCQKRISPCSVIAFLVVVWILLHQGITAFADTSGACGENLTWSLNDEGTLTISGVGPMDDYLNNQPWKDEINTIKKIIIEEKVTSIGTCAFSGSSSLVAVTIPNSVTYIGSSAFAACTNLTSIIIPNSVTSIHYNAFNECRSLTSVSIMSRSTSFLVPTDFFNDGTQGSNQGTFHGCVGLKTAGPLSGDYNIKFGWTDSIPNNAFYGCNSLTNVTIPNGVTSIGLNAFRFCNELTSVTIPNSVKNIRDRAFYGCSGLTELQMPKGLTTIGKNVFHDCANLTLIVSQNSAAYDYANANGLPYILSGEFETADFILPNNIQEIENAAFEGIAATVIFIPDTCKRIRTHAFLNSKLVQIRIPAGCSIEDDAFEGCVDLLVFGMKGSPAENYCNSHTNCTFVVEAS